MKHCVATVLTLAAVCLLLSGCIVIPLAALAAAKIGHYAYCEKQSDRCKDE
jgi:hypothetical protein